MKKILCVILSVLCLFMCFAGLSCAADAACAHEYVPTVIAPTCAEKGYTVYVCIHCGNYYYDDYTGALGHSYGAWTTVDTATCTAEGHDTRECSRCHAVEEKTYPVLEHKDTDKNGKCDTCGADVETAAKKKVFVPFDWLMSFFKAVREWFSTIFA